MPIEMVELACRRAAEHIRIFNREYMWFALHGGDPFALGSVEYLEKVLSTMRRIIPLSPLDAPISVQTSAFGLDDRKLALARKYGVNLGISLDGDRSDNRFRVTHSGRPTFGPVVEVLEKVNREYRDVFGGIISVLHWLRVDNPANPGEKLIHTYEFLSQFKPPQIDFLLPHGRRPGSDESPLLFGRALVALFDYWLENPLAEIRLLRSLIGKLITPKGRFEAFGQARPDALLVGADGEMQHPDTFKSVKAASLGCNVAANPLHAVRSHPDMVALSAGVFGLGDICQACEFLQVCEGGHPADRYFDGHYLLPSAYCDDLQHFIGHATTTLKRMVANARI